MAQVGRAEAFSILDAAQGRETPRHVWSQEWRGEWFLPNSRRIAGLVGPTIMATIAAEFPPVQPDLYAAQIPPVVYLSGVLMFVGGLAIIRSHNIWVRDWTVLVTLSGWFGVGLGLFRMFAASQYQQMSADTGTTAFMIVEGVLFVGGSVMTYYAYRPLRTSGEDAAERSRH